MITSKTYYWSEDPDTTIVSPNPADVLCGRGRYAFEHEGNSCLRREIADNLDEYKSKSRSAKTRMIRALVQAVHDRGGRFLKRDEKASSRDYYVAGYNDARQKVSAAIRDACSEKVKCMMELRSSSSDSKKAASGHEEVAAHQLQPTPLPFGTTIMTWDALTDQQCVGGEVEESGVAANAVRSQHFAVECVQSLGASRSLELALDIVAANVPPPLAQRAGSADLSGWKDASDSDSEFRSYSDSECLDAYNELMLGEINRT